MKALNMFMGLILSALGVLCFANSGLSAISLAFPMGLILMTVGIVESLSYRNNNTDEEDKHWILIEGLSTFVLGILLITGQLNADIAILSTFGFWSIITGIRTLVIYRFEAQTTPKRDKIWRQIVGYSTLIIGFYGFFNNILFHCPVLTYLGIVFLAEGGNLIKIGVEATYFKPEIIKTQEEKIIEAEYQAKVARQKVKEALKEAKEAKEAIKEIDRSLEIQEVLSKPIGEDNVKVD